MQRLTALALLAWAKAPEAPLALKKGVSHLGDLLDRGFSFGGIQVTVGSLLGGVLVFGLFLIAIRVLKRLLHRYGERNGHVSQSTLYTVERLFRYVMLVVGLLWALDVIGIPIAKMTVFAGALGVGLGFGLQAIFNNFVSGLILLFDRSLKVGDFVELASGVHGHVREIRIRATLISTNDDIDILVPNSEFVTGRVVNWTLREVARRQKIPFGVAYGTDKELVKKAALEAAVEVPFTLSLDGPRAPQVEIPFPQRDLHVRSWAKPQDSDQLDSDAEPAASTPAAPAHGNDAARDVERDIAEESAKRKNPSPHDPDVTH
jgi:small-conductance mechanosensitive channel